MKILKKLYCIIILVMIMTGCTEPQKLDNTSPEYGNTCGNIHQSGYGVEKDGWIYYCDFSGDGSYELRNCLFKKRTDGSEKQNLSSNWAYEINVVGDFAYYTSGDPGPIYKININSKKTKMLQGGHSNDNLIVIDDTIYYRHLDRLCTMNTNGSKKKTLIKDVLRFSIEENYIYYTTQSTPGLYKADLNGNVIKKLSNDNAIDINIDDGWLYYWESDNFKLYKLKDDGSEKILVCDDDCSGLNLHNGVLYYHHKNKTLNSSLRKINVDGTGKSKLIDGCIEDFNIINNCIIYHKVVNGSGYYKSNLDGTNQKLLDEW